MLLAQMTAARHVDIDAEKEGTAKVVEVGTWAGLKTEGKGARNMGNSLKLSLLMFVHCFYMENYISLRVYV